MALSLMTPSDIIYKATHFLPPNLRNITKFAFHFTDINNASSILNRGKLLSRNRAIEQGLMINDNASTDVIVGTDEEVHDFARFYFRPKTPTQYYNEGIHSLNEIHSELNAHCPVPVFFLFDINKLLEKDDVYFTHESLASHYYVEKYNYQEHPQNLIDAPFNHIYHYNPIQGGENTQKIIKRRHAEILVDEECDLSFLKLIVCRNSAELRTLKSLLDPIVLEEYNDIIKTPNDPTTFFYNNRTRINSVKFDSDKDLYIKWAGSNPNSSFKFQLKIFSHDCIERLKYVVEEDYKPFSETRDKIYWLTGKSLKKYKKCLVQIKLNDHLVYKNVHSL